MAKNYPEQLGEWVKQRTSSRRDRNLVAFLAVKADVKAAIHNGYAVKTIWANMQESGRVNFSYDTFLNYVNRHVRRQNTVETVSLPEALIVPAPRNVDARVGDKKNAVKTKVAVPAGFTFDPSPNKKDLL